jgi:hypothetical protein
VGHRPGTVGARRVQQEHRSGQRRRGPVPRQHGQRRAGRRGQPGRGGRGEPAGGPGSPSGACATSPSRTTT